MFGAVHGSIALVGVLDCRLRGQSFNPASTESCFRVATPLAFPNERDYKTIMLMVNCSWEDQSARERTDNPPSYMLYYLL